MDATDPTMAAINAALGCAHCGSLLGPSAPSPDFCSEECQTAWLAQPAPSGPTVVRPGHEILDEVAAFVSRFSAFPSEDCAPMLALWYAHTHAAEHFYATPRLILDSAEPGSGKTRVLEVAQYLVAAPEMTISATTAAIFRMVSDGPITILFDEVDAIFNTKNGGNNEDLRALLNAGYKRSATVSRCVGDARAMKVERFAVYAPAALAGIAGHMPDTITTRAITIHMRRRAPDERVEPFRERTVEAQAAPLREQLAAWIASISVQLADATPTMPPGVADRSAEIWEPLLAIADHAGNHWPDTARAACRHFVLQGRDRDNGSLGVRLLADLRDLYATRGVDRLATSDILTALHQLEEAPWADLYGKPLDNRRLAKELKRYGVVPRDIKTPGSATAVKGYRLDGTDGLADAFRRYLPQSATAATAATSQVNTVADRNPYPRLPRPPDPEPP